MKKNKKIMLTQAEYDALAQSSDWRKVELGLDAIQGTPGIQRKADLLGAYQSGDATVVKNLNGRNAIFGMDVIVYERRPKCKQGESWVNAYHYTITKTDDPTLPFCLEGPFTKETLIGHRPTSLDLSSYEEPTI
jgi:hypothetical protein